MTQSSSARPTGTDAAAADEASPQLLVTGTQVTGNWDSDRQGRVVLGVTRTGGDGRVEETTVVELPTGELIVGVDGQDRRERHHSIGDAVRAEEVLHRLDQRSTAIWTLVLPSWQLVDLLDGDYVEINGGPWHFDGQTWWPEDGYDDDPAYDNDVATAIFKVPGAGGMTGGPVSAIRLQRLGDRYWWHDWEREEHDRTRASTPREALQWFADGLDGKIVDFTCRLLDGLDDDTIAALLPGYGPAIWANGDLWRRTDGNWARQPDLPATDVGDVDLVRVQLCEHIGPCSDDYRWLELTLTPSDTVPGAEPAWWWVLVADPEPETSLLEFLADAVFGSTEDPTPNHPPTVLAHLGRGLRWVGVSTDLAEVAGSLASVIPRGVRIAGNQELLWVVGADGQPSWTFEASLIEAPSDGDVIPLVDPTW